MSLFSSRPTGRRSLTVVLGGVLASTLALAPARADASDDYYVPVTDQLSLHGHGFGHGRGMSQYGAQGAALRGLSWQQIIAFYYPGTSLATAGGSIKVLLTSAPGARDLTVSSARGLTVRDLGSGRRWSVPTAPDAWRFHVNANNRVEVHFHDGSGWHLWRLPTGARVLTGEGEFQASQPLSLWTPAGKRRYRERLRTARLPGSSSLLRATVNTVSLDKYVQGVVASEMPSSWEPAAVRAQAVAARSYAVRNRNADPNDWFDVDDTTRYQVYGGFDHETSATNAAVRDTALQVVQYGGTTALTEFSASSGGWSAGSSLPYQQVKEDPYDGVAPNRYHDWTETVDVGHLERVYPSIGRLERIEVVDRNGGGDWGGRIETAVLHGSDNDVRVSGDDLRRIWGLASNWFSAEPTPIIRRWLRLGGPDSWLGAVRSAENAVTGGAEQRFDRGRIYWSARNGAHELYGGILNRYLTVGGPDSALRLPRTAERDAGVPGGRFNLFQRGGIYWSSATGAHAVYAGINGAYLRVGGARGIGLPKGEEHDAAVPGSRTSAFQRGDIYWSSKTGAHPVYGGVRAALNRVGGVAGIGLPLADEKDAGVPGGRVSPFQRGDIYWSSDTGAHPVYGAIRYALRRVGGVAAIGLPLADERDAGVPGGRVSPFQRADIYWSRATGAHSVYGGIRAAYRRYGGPTSALGLPTGNEYAVAGGRRQDFQGGWIRWDFDRHEASITLT